jgi:hypothetical protein
MPLSAKELDRRTLQLIRYVISKFTKDKKWWLEKWDRSELLSDGYSDRVVAKAKQYDIKAASSPSAWIVVFWMVVNPTKGREIWTLFILCALYLGWWIYWQSRYKKAQLSYADNLLVLEELTKKLGADALERAGIPEEHPLLESWSRRLEKRAILWRLDAFLSRKPMNA